jgi:transcriptional regulator with PAS, ATPase and Fis domain
MTKESFKELWQELVTLPLIERMKEAVAQRWGISLHFTNASGWLQGVQPGQIFSPVNPVCRAICATKHGYQDRKSTALNVTAKVLGGQKSTMSTCKTGISVLALPIVIDDKVIGSVYADGFVLSDTAELQRNRIRQYLDTHVGAAKSLLEKVDKISSFAADDLEFLSLLIHSISEQLVDLNKRYNRTNKSLSNLSRELLGDEKQVFPGIVGSSAAMQEVYVTLDKVKDAMAPILVTGENGTGKELIAKSLHYESVRGKKPFLAMNCGAFNETLLDSELFGHVKGAFTGATGNKKGLLEEASEGTLFLDELGEMPLSMQVKLLRVLQEGTFMPVGSTKEKKTNARIICATNRDLAKLIKKGEFREDLYYRLDVIKVRVPSLREREEDIPNLVAHFVKKYGTSEQFAISSEVMSALRDYNWPGNIRQLENEIQRLSLMNGNATVAIDDLNDEIKSALNSSKKRFKLGGELKSSIENYERDLIVEGLKKHDGNKTALAKELGMSRPSLMKKIKKYDVAG